jgi:hypothetical protein
MTRRSQQPVEAGTALLRELVREPVVGLSLGLCAGVRDPLQHRHRARADHLYRDQVLTRQPEQQRRRVVLHRSRQQELVELLELQRRRHPPAEVLRYQIGAALSFFAVST